MADRNQSKWNWIIIPDELHLRLNFKDVSIVTSLNLINVLLRQCQASWPWVVLDKIIVIMDINGYFTNIVLLHQTRYHNDQYQIFLSQYPPTSYKKNCSKEIDQRDEGKWQRDQFFGNISSSRFSYIHHTVRYKIEYNEYSLNI